MNMMKPFVGLTSRRSMLRGGLVGPGLMGAAAGLLLLGTTGVLAEDEGTYVLTNLVSNVVGQAKTTDPNLQNAWVSPMRPTARSGFPTTTTAYRHSTTAMEIWYRWPS
jgi:hypothetical protein